MIHREVAVDEAMIKFTIKFTGQSSLKQYIPMKPIKQGIKCGLLLTATMATSTSSRKEGSGEKQLGR